MTIFSTYYNAGLAVIPLNPARNNIPVFKWGVLYEGWYRPSDDDLLSWDLNADLNVALACGKPSGVVALDLDHVTEKEIQQVRKFLPDTPCAKFGKKGLTLFFRYNNEDNQNWRTKDGVLRVELIANKRHCTIPPSKHRDGDVHYKWVGQDLLSTHHSLPKLPENFAEIIDSIFSIIREPEPTYPKLPYEVPPTFDEAVRALEHCDPNCGNDDWVKIGMAFKKIVGDAGYHEFDLWSSRGNSYKKNEMRLRWRSFTSKNITYGTLIYFAKQHGNYMPPRKYLAPIQALPPREFTRMKLIHEVKKVEESEEIPAIVTNAPRLIKLLTEWMYQSAPHPQPMLSLGAAITTIGFVMGKDFACARSGIKANLYSVCIAGSQEGKQEIVSRARAVLKEFKLMKNYQTSWTSGAAIETMMEETKGQIYYITDEMGILMGQLVGKYTSANQQEAVSTLLRLYTENYYKGKHYAKSAERPPVEIDNPFVSICGFTQREPFFEAMSSMQAHTGVLNRMCLFKAPDVRPKYNPNYNATNRDQMPPELKAELDVLIKNLPQYRIGKDYVQALQEVPFTDEAWEALQKIIIETDERFRRSQLNGENIHLFIGRSPEVIQKLALIGSCGELINLEVLNWAKSVVDYTIGLMIKYSTDIADTEFDRKKNKTLDYLRRRGGLASKTDLTSNCRVYSNRKEREEVLNDLLDAEKIELVEEKEDGRNKLYYKLATPKQELIG